MTWSARLWIAAFFASVQLGALGCGAHRAPWPSDVGAQANGRFMAGGQVRTIDVLPVDVQAWSDGRAGIPDDQLTAGLVEMSTGAAVTALAQHGYQVVAAMNWGGQFLAPDGRPAVAMTPDEVAVTAHALSGYGYAVAEANQGLLAPHLPVRLGARTGSDATLYVGGWAYVGHDDGPSTGSKIAKGVLIGLFIAVVLVVVIAGVKKGGGGAGKVAGGVGRAATGAGRAMANAGHAAARAVTPLLRGAARVGVEVVRGAHTVDCFGRGGTHISIYDERPDYYAQEVTPKAGPSQMYLEMTLVDNRTGAALWHARHTFPADATRVDQVGRALALMTMSLPRP
jgi:hypothetical protein